MDKPPEDAFSRRSGERNQKVLGGAPEAVKPCLEEYE